MADAVGRAAQAARRLRIDVLGPIRVRAPDGADATPSGALQRRLLALLVLRRGRVVPAEVAIDALWPVSPPREPAAALHTHVSRLRRALPVDVVDSVADGYRLEPALVDLDAERAAVALDVPDPTDPAVRRALDELLEAWQGPAYPELDDVDEGKAEAARLAELRVRALEARAECRLALGDTDGLAAELAALADAEPLRERPRALLMGALAATGRTVEALRVYDDFRRLLGDELGIEPSPALAAQHDDLLRRTGPAAWAPVTRLPVPAASLVGRAELLEDVVRAVQHARVTTLVGPGGVGKTRLAVEVGHQARAARPDRPVVLCELATARPGAALDVAAAALGIDARPGVPIVERITGVLGHTELVLVLDNCEHVLDEVAELVEDVLPRCPRVSVLATSRERLRVPGEQVRVVPSLPADAADAAGVQLFVERARAVVPGFEPGPDELRTIRDVVRRLDGLPLAIELAAARLHTLDLPEVAAGLDDRFTLLSSGYRASPRHGSLGAAVSWSYDLLDRQLQQVFTALSVFRGPFSAADAAAVCGLAEPRAAAALAQLAERSLVARAPRRRYLLLETLRAFGAEQLTLTGRAAEVRDRHARHVVAWVEAADRRLLEADGAPLGEIDDALPELAAGLDWLVERGEVEPAGRLVAALCDYGFLRLRPDVLAWAERVTVADPADRSPVAAEVWVAAAYAAWLAGDVAATRARSQRALQAARSAGRGVITRVAGMCGNVELFEGRLADAARWYRQGVEASGEDRARRLIFAGTELLALAYAADPDATRRADEVLAELGPDGTAYAAYVWYCAGEADLALRLPPHVERARARFTRSLELAEATGASFVVGVAGASRASIDARLGDPVAAAGAYRRLISHWRRAGVWSTQWTMLRSIALLLARLGRPREAAVLEGAVRSTPAGHRIFGADEAALAELSARLRAELGDAGYKSALAQGAALDGDAAVEHALRSL